MAKGKSGKRGTRDTSESLTVRLRSLPKALPSRLPEFDPRPNSRPDIAPAKLFSGVTASVNVNKNAGKAGGRGPHRAPHVVKFTAPKETLICVRRHRRKEVLHALKKTGKGGQKKPRRTPWRDYQC